MYYLETGKEPEKISKQEKLETILKHIEMEESLKKEDIAIKEMRKHIAWYVKGLKDSSKIRDAVNKIETKKEMEECITEYFKNI